MIINKFIFYLLCNKSIIVNLHKLHFPSFPFSLQPNKRVFHLPTLSPLQPNTQERKTKYFPSSHFSIIPQFFIFSLFHYSNQTDPKRNSLYQFMLLPFESSTTFFLFFSFSFCWISTTFCWFGCGLQLASLIIL